MNPVTDPVLVFAIVAALILLAPMVLGRWRLPGMIGLLLAGAILGPNALGLLARDQSFELLGAVGLLYIMFTAGLEVDLQVFKRYKYHGFIFGMLTFAIPQGLGTLVAYYVFGFALMPAILLASMFASHTLLAYPIVSRLGLAKSLPTTTAIGGTILTDTLALLVLAVIAGMHRGEANEAFWYRLSISLTLYVVAILFGLPYLARWFFKNVGRDGVSEFVFVLAVVFGCSSMAHLAGVEPIIGAFLAGLSLNRLIPHNSALMNRIQFTGEAIFIPFFLLSVGMLFDARIFAGGTRSWIIAIGMLVTVIVTKWLAAEVTRVLFRFNRDEGRIIFSLSVAQAAATLAAVLVGYEIGLFDDAVVNGAVLMILGTCILSPWVADRAGRRLALNTTASTPTANLPPQRVLVAMAHKDAALPLLDLGLLMRERTSDQPIYPLTIVEDEHGSADQVAAAEKLLGEAVIHLASADVPSAPITRIDLNVAAAILRARREVRATEVVIGWSDRLTTQDYMFGSILEKLFQDRNYTLVVARLVEPLNLTKRVIYVVPPNADTETSFPTSVAMVKRIAKQTSAALLVVAEREQEARLRARLGRLAVGEFKVHALEGWSFLTQALADTVIAGDLVILHESRPTGTAWTPVLIGTPARIAKRFLTNNLLVAYSAEPFERMFDPLAEELNDSGTIRADVVRLGIASKSIDEAVGKLLRSIPAACIRDLDHWSTGGADACAKALVGSRQIIAGRTIVLHQSDASIKEHCLLVGTTALIGAEADAQRVLIIILDPVERDARQHLALLARLARSVQSAATIDEAIACTTVECFTGLLNLELARAVSRRSSSSATGDTLTPPGSAPVVDGGAAATEHEPSLEPTPPPT